MRLMTILEACHHDANGNVLWQASNLHNTFHNTGEEFFLKTLFTQQVALPTTYFVGLDNRLTINQADIMSGLLGEPSGNGYSRIGVGTSAGFGAEFVSGKWVVKSTTVLFRANGTWATVRNAFLTTGTSNSGYLIASVPLLSPRTLTAGQAISFRFVLGLGV